MNSSWKIKETRLLSIEFIGMFNAEINKKTIGAQSDRKGINNQVL